jgi:hypothetical protein
MRTAERVDPEEERLSIYIALRYKSNPVHGTVSGYGAGDDPALVEAGRKLEAAGGEYEVLEAAQIDSALQTASLHELGTKALGDPDEAPVSCRASALLQGGDLFRGEAAVSGVGLFRGNERSSAAAVGGTGFSRGHRCILLPIVRPFLHRGAADAMVTERCGNPAVHAGSSQKPRKHRSDKLSKKRGAPVAASIYY